MSHFINSKGSSFLLFCKHTIKRTPKPNVSGAGWGAGGQRGGGKCLLPGQPGTLRPGHNLHGRELTLCNATSASLSTSPGRPVSQPSAAGLFFLQTQRGTCCSGAIPTPACAPRSPRPVGRPAARPATPPPPRSHSLSRRRRLNAGSPRRFRSK